MLHREGEAEHMKVNSTDPGEGYLEDCLVSIQLDNHHGSEQRPSILLSATSHQESLQVQGLKSVPTACSPSALA